MIKRITLLQILALMALCINVSGQDIRNIIRNNPNRLGGILERYEYTDHKDIEAPKGYKPFYIGMYCRHGSRFLAGKTDYEIVSDAFEKAKDLDILTNEGKKVYNQVMDICNIASDRYGDLTNIGKRQLKDIAYRMYNKYPQVFQKNDSISCTSTKVHRVLISMISFVDEIKRFSPNIKVGYDSSNRYLFYNYDNNKKLSYNIQDKILKNGKNFKDERKQIEHFCDSIINSDRFVDLLFTNRTKLNEIINPHILMRKLFAIYIGQQNVDEPIIMDNIFTEDEKFNLWQADNAEFYFYYGPSPLNKDIPQKNVYSIIHDFISKADYAIKNKGISANLRFGHDIYLLPLASAFRFEGYNNRTTKLNEICNVWQNFNIATKAGNIQMILYKNTKNKTIIAKFLMNEKDMKLPIKAISGNYYNWNDIKQFYKYAM